MPGLPTDVVSTGAGTGAEVTHLNSDGTDEELLLPLLAGFVVRELGSIGTSGGTSSATLELEGQTAGSTSPSIWQRIEISPGVIRDEEGRVTLLFGFTPAEADDVLRVVSREKSLPSSYWPPDLVSAPGARSNALVRRVMLADLQDLITAARRANVQLTPVSGFRSYATQANLFEARARDFHARAGGQMDVEEARQRANLGTALPGQSQHQLGTAVDFSTPHLGYRVTPSFAETVEGVWLREHAAEFGFVFPYTHESRPLTGYIAEPWHVRWVGRPLAAFLMAEGYLTSTEVTVDTYLEAIEAHLETRS